MVGKWIGRLSEASLSWKKSWLAFALLLCALTVGCRTPEVAVHGRPFALERDAFAYKNELTWDYFYNDEGRWVGKARDPKPDYTLRCFVVARSARQFYYHARFEPGRAKVSRAEYRRLVERILSRAPRKPTPDRARVAIPGYADLHSFSADHADMLKQECGGAWRSYFQRGHWRMVFPFNRSHQARTAKHILFNLQRNRPPVLHVVRFPQLSINHAIMVYDAVETDAAIKFQAYDPNEPAEPLPLSYDRRSRTFSLPPSNYFHGGRVDVYEVYHRWNY